MGAYWLNNSVTPLSKALGTKFKLYKGYATRSRSSGGFDSIRGIVIHHDADRPTGDDLWVLEYEWNRTGGDQPIGNYHVMRNGDVWLGTAGASNHAGKGGPVGTSKGTVPLNTANRMMIGIEASNDGVGEPWGNAILDSYLILVQVLCVTYKLNPLTDIYGHADWVAPSCPGRKIDPAGPTPKYPKFGGTSGRATWNIQEFRKEVNARINTTPAPVPPPASQTDWSALGATYSTPPPILKKGDVHANVPWLQAVLSSMKTKSKQPPVYYNPEWVSKDNIGGTQQANLYGEATFNAVKGFQIDYQLYEDGIYGTVTADKMYAVRGK